MNRDKEIKEIEKHSASLGPVPKKSARSDSEKIKQLRLEIYKHVGPEEMLAIEDRNDAENERLGALIRQLYVEIKLLNPLGVDESIVEIINALNDAGHKTIASCCGHGNQPTRISLKDGRELFIADYEKAQKISAMFPWIHAKRPVLGSSKRRKPR